MKPKVIHPHPFASEDPVRRGDKYAVRYCDVCSLPESRVDVHTLPPTPADVTATEQRRLGEGDH